MLDMINPIDIKGKVAVVTGAAGDDSDSNAIRSVAARIFSVYGRLNVWLNNVGMVPRAEARQINKAACDRSLDVKLRSVVSACRPVVGAIIHG
jgi:NAD(P)-dependent dehydrogenase (short-subunit alcohol dehydrogenase family)